MGSDRVHVLLRLFQSDARFKTAHHEEPVEVVIDLFRLEDQGDRELSLLAIEDAGALHSDDGVRIAIHAQGGADNFWICAEFDPQLMGEDNNMIASGYALLR